jgi:hypothetical protein
LIRQVIGNSQTVFGPTHEYSCLVPRFISI